MVILKKIVLNFSLIIILFLLFSIPCKASDYYVDTTGSDSYNGLYEAYQGGLNGPWRTIQKAAKMMTAGDTCIVLPGIYNERVDTYISGNAGAPITYRASGLVTMQGFTVRASYVTIKGFYITGTADNSVHGVGVNIMGSHCVVEDNEIYYTTREGIELYISPGDSSALSDCVIRNNKIHRSQGVGISVYGQNHLIEGNEVYGIIQYHPGWINPPSYVDADGMHFFGSGHIFRGNYIHDISYNDAENINPHIDCFQTWGPAYNITFEKNVCKLKEAIGDLEISKAFQIEATGGVVHHLTIRNNILEVFQPMGVGHAHYLTVQNNTIRGTFGVVDYWPVGIELTNCTYASIKNNIFYDVGAGTAPHLWLGGDTTGLDAGYNLVYMSEDRTPAGSPRTNDQWMVNPIFVNAAAGDYHLSTGSGAIDTGSPFVSVTDDFDGNSRLDAYGVPIGGAYDIGAYEYVSGDITPTITPPFTHCTPLGDIDCSGKVNILDLSALLSAFGSTTNKTADLDNSGKVNMIDLSILLQNFGK